MTFRTLDLLPSPGIKKGKCRIILHLTKAMNNVQNNFIINNKPLSENILRIIIQDYILSVVLYGISFDLSSQGRM
jgi:hypothetical protein